MFAHTQRGPCALDEHRQTPFGVVRGVADSASEATGTSSCIFVLQTDGCTQIDPNWDAIESTGQVSGVLAVGLLVTEA